MTESEARDFLAKYLSAAIKIRSNVLEKICGKNQPTPTQEMMLMSMYPVIFADKDKINLIGAIQKTLQQEKIEPITLYNVINLGNGSLAMNIQCDMMELEIPCIHPLPEWLSGWSDE